MTDLLSSLSAPGQGTAIDSLVSQYMSLERRPVEALRSTKDQLNVRYALFTDLKAKINELKGVAEALTTTTDSVFSAHTVSVSDSSLLAATASSSASNGSYLVEDVVLATAHRVRSAQVASDWTAGAGSFVVNGALIQVAAGDTLSDVRDAINSASYATGRQVVATVVDRILVLEGKSTGADRELKVADLTGGLLSSLGLATTSSSALAVASVTASSEADGSHPGQNVVDGLADDQYSWIGAEGQANWTLTLDLGSSQTVSRLQWGRDRGGLYSDRTPQGYSLEYWDGEDWQTLKSVVGASLEAGATRTDSFYPVTTSQLRMTITATNDGTAPAIDEMELFSDVGSFSLPALRSPSDASFTVNGLSVTRSSNSGLSDVVSGLTLELKQSGGAATIQVADDTASMRGKIQSFLDKLNGLTDYLRARSGVSQDGTGNYTRGPLNGHGLYSGLHYQLAADLQSVVEGLSETAPSRLSQLGIAMDSNLRFVVEDSAALDDWLSDNPSGVAALFGGESGVAQRVLDRIEPYVAVATATSSSYLDQEQSAITSQHTSLDARIKALNERLALREQALRLQFMKLQALMIDAVQQQQRMQSIFSYGVGQGSWV